jgi:TRAP-type C4-dicarboxylate transport system permease small subunit
VNEDTPHADKPGDQAARLRSERYLDSESRVEGSDPRENLNLWIAVLGSAVVWFVQMQTNYTLVSWVCATGHHWTLYLACVLALAAAALPGWIGWKCWRENSTDRETERESAGAGRRRFMALLGVMLSALFFLLIFAQALPHFFIDPCIE